MSILFDDNYVLRDAEVIKKTFNKLVTSLHMQITFLNMGKFLRAKMFPYVSHCVHSCHTRKNKEVSLLYLTVEVMRKKIR